ncbi:MAG: hypothetical protein FWG21_00035 [Oscillospiraceae bacterium]|nr:hypothetical protein [Oscillospiraceae bacterium]
MRRNPKSNQSLIRSTEERLKNDRILVNNPVFIEGLALTPVIGAATTLRNATILSIMIPILLIPTRFIGNILIGTIPQKLRIMVYSVVAALIYIPGLSVITNLFGMSVAAMGIYLPILVVDSIITSPAEIPQREKGWSCLLSGILSSVGFAMSVFLVGALRELLGHGSLWGSPIISPAPFPIFTTAVGGLIIAAAFCAVFQFLVSLIKRARYRYAKDTQFTEDSDETI